MRNPTGQTRARVAGEAVWGERRVVSREATQTNRGEEVDCEAGVLWVVTGEHALEVLLHERVSQSLVQLLQPKRLGKLLSRP